VRLDRELDKDVDEVVKEESVDRSTALRMLIGEGYRGWKLKRALRGLRDGETSLQRAAEVAGVPLLDFIEIVKKEGIEWTEFDPRETLERAS
jgi:predicted HTH domain antitoxin